MNAKVLLLMTVVAAAAADKPSVGYGVPDSHSHEDSFEVPKYEFEWKVDDSESGNHYGQQEARDDEHTQGGYYVHLPDGRVQKVAYVVDGDSGYLAEVTYEGEARHPDSHSHEYA